MGPKGLTVLAVDDVPAALDELVRMLRDAPEVDEVHGAADPIAVLKMIHTGRFDAVFLDISMPGLDGLELASLLRKLSEPPAIVFVTAHEEHAVAAFGIGAVDYLLKPLRAERLADTLARLGRHAEPAPKLDAMAALPVEAAGRTHYIRRSEVYFVEAQGDYVRLHTKAGSHLVRMPISRLQEYWESAGFARVHRGYLLSLSFVRELRSDSAGGLLAHTEAGDVPVSRRHSRELRERLLRAAQHGELDRRA
ncbi:LytR/AlgR family response regulator transcription factor [Kibdelosporangium phytohabitans]|uniref:LytR family transcriptional regulator n=1 Tax=Kibdelosporangium phytohabitans TaxID=860235 RepID=A0A0N9I5Z0_9PSEU|nr:LytTR family DNA-binding domain-containing protein [Kibdelosporangium phytohabitans]ALG11561.1 LytR family transcriptional regulator [Kibdelosporangium phytohabitans]